MSMDTEQNLRTFISKWGTDFDTVIASFREHLADDVVWDQPGVAVTHTCQEAIDLLKGFKEQVDMATFEATIVQLAVNGNVAIAERIDHLRRSDRSLIASLPVTGVFEYNSEGKISAWREYFDSASVLKAIEGASA